MYEINKKTRDPVIELFMKIDGRIEYVIGQIIDDKTISEEDIERLIKDKEHLLKFFEGKTEKSREMHYDNVWSANNLINKIDYILDLKK